ncbi:MAG: efflux RND transporter periplasmic adaptor subunit [Rhodocyclaceae bacterium]|nr:MAG: efflux RND transporter periplasmic adaptor subunit [Rhodocyclaceae bacterium]
MKNKKIALWMVVVGVGIVGGAYFYFGGQKVAPQGKPVAPVVVARAEARDVPLLLALTGRAEALESVSLRARVDGQVQAVPMQEGGRVKKGDVLVQLDPADFAARLAQAEANLSRDQALAAKARADVERYVALRQKGFVSEEMLGSMRTNAAAQEAAVKASQAALELARLQLGYATIRAPFDGVVGARLVFPGSAVKVNDTLLAVVNKVKPLFVSFAVPEKYLPKIRAAMKDGVMKVGVAVPGATARETEGEARFLDNAVDATTGTIRMKATVANADESLTAGQFLNISLALDQLKGVVTVPAEAVQQGPEGAYVYLAKEDETVEVRRVVVIAIQGGMALLDQGLAAGETVVVDGQMRLSPGAKYRTLEPKPANHQ